VTDSSSTSQAATAVTSRAIVAAVFWLAAWQVLAMTVGQRIVLASPVQVVQALFRLVPTAQFWETLAASGLRIIAGFAFGLILGALLAFTANASKWAAAIVAPPMRAARSVPVVSFVILVLLWAGPQALTVTVAAIMVAPIAFANISEGLTRTDPELEDVAKVFAASPLQRFRAITWPTVLPFLAAACQAGIGLAWKAGVSAEVIGLPSGSIGERLYAARLTLATDTVLAWTVTIVAASWLLEHLATRALARHSG
jgi:NitT/TauT family transport system permease protein